MPSCPPPLCPPPPPPLYHNQQRKRDKQAIRSDSLLELTMSPSHSPSPADDAVSIFPKQPLLEHEDAKKDNMSEARRAMTDRVHHVVNNSFSSSVSGEGRSDEWDFGFPGYQQQGKSNPITTAFSPPPIPPFSYYQPHSRPYPPSPLPRPLTAAEPHPPQAQFPHRHSCSLNDISWQTTQNPNFVGAATISLSPRNNVSHDDPITAPRTCSSSLPPPVIGLLSKEATDLKTQMMLHQNTRPHIVASSAPPLFYPPPARQSSMPRPLPPPPPPPPAPQSNANQAVNNRERLKESWESQEGEGMSDNNGWTLLSQDGCETKVGEEKDRNGRQKTRGVTAAPSLHLPSSDSRNEYVMYGNTRVVVRRGGN